MPGWKEKFKDDPLNNAAALVAILGGAAALIFFAASLEGRVAKLEERLKPSAAISVNTPQEADGSSAKVMQVNPLSEKCADILDRTAKANEQKEWVVASSLESLGRRYGCTER